MESIAFEIMVSCQVQLQEPHGSSKARDHAAALDRRLDAWLAGDLKGLLREARTVQNHLSMPCTKNEQGDKVARVFSRLMLESKKHAALWYLSENEQHGLLSLDDSYGSGTVLDILQEKHPSARPVQPDALLSVDNTCTPSVHPVLFERITGDTIHYSALRTQGSAGPSGIDVAGWRHLLVCFHRESKDLCLAVAKFALRLCTEYIDPQGIRAYVACR